MYALLSKYEIISNPIISGDNESWWLGGVEETFGSTMTSAKTSVLQSELDSCQELLQLEPDNKCEPRRDMQCRTIVLWAFID